MRQPDPVVSLLHFTAARSPCCWTGRCEAVAVGGDKGDICGGGQLRPLRRWSATSAAVGAGRWGWRKEGAREDGER
jgi:hypothetical protein